MRRLICLGYCGLMRGVRREVVADIATGNGNAVVTRDRSKLHEAQAISDYVVSAREMLKVQVDSLRATQFLIESFNREHTHLCGHLKLQRFNGSNKK